MRSSDPTIANGTARGWPLQRVVSVGYLALVDFGRVRPQTDYVSDRCEWRLLTRLPPLAFDHRVIVRSALASLRAAIDSPALARNLLPPQFTMPELPPAQFDVAGRPLERGDAR